jgi:uncharacterized protein
MTAIDTRPAALQIALERGVTNPPGRSRIHGEDHWKCVALAGLWIAERTPGADLEFILTFAALHDVMRENDSSDPIHGPRAAQLLVGLLDDPGLDGFPPQSQRSQDLLFAISHHTGTDDARDHSNVNVGICWDADRVNLWRVWKRPQPRFLTTVAAVSGSAIDCGRWLCKLHLCGELPSWAEIERCCARC